MPCKIFTCCEFTIYVFSVCTVFECTEYAYINGIKEIKIVLSFNWFFLNCINNLVSVIPCYVASLVMVMFFKHHYNFRVHAVT